ncbi:MAG: hypothetical protein ACLPHP_16775 [Candidatus Sulfotelmatobacter sp.]
MKIANSIRLGMVLLLARVPAWTQDNTPSVPASAAGGAQISTSPNTPANADTSVNLDSSEIPMLTPPPVSGQSYPVAPVSQERSNYLRGGVTFTSAYSDNVLGSTSASSKPVSDVSYSVWPTLALDETTTRLHWTVNYAPGFTFYQRTSARNEQDQNASISFQYRLSPHVTFSAVDSFQKSSNVFNQPDLASAGAVSGGAQGDNFSVIAPIADQLHNFGTLGITYQFAANAMIGAGGIFANLHYPNQAQVPGLFDSESQGGSGFYAYRISAVHYLGISYQYQRLLSFPTQGQNETQTDSVFPFYVFSPSKRFSVSMFGGPQYSDIQFNVGTTNQTGSRSWTPAGGASINWQGQFTSLAVSYTHTIASGGGLIGAVEMNAANASIRQQIAKALTASLSGGYFQNTVLGNLPQVVAGSTNGHSISGTAALQRMFGEHLNVQLGYTRIHQTYNVAAISTTPDTNREFVSLAYQFSRPLGR